MPVKAIAAPPPKTTTFAKVVVLKVKSPVHFNDGKAVSPRASGAFRAIADVPELALQVPAAHIIHIEVLTCFRCGAMHDNLIDFPHSLPPFFRRQWQDGQELMAPAFHE